MEGGLRKILKFECSPLLDKHSGYF